MNTATTIYGDVKPGDWVIAAGNNDYEYLIGIVTAIDKLGTPEHGTENETDDVHVDFTAFDYPPQRLVEIEERFTILSGQAYPFSELPLDDVIMAPKMLISISNLSQDEITRMGNLRENCEAFCNCFAKPEPQSEKHAELMERLDKNLADYHDSLMDFGKRELIEMADKIAAMSVAHSCLSYRGFDDSELDFFLQFQNPLEVAAEGWLDYTQDVHDEMGYALDEVLRNKQGWLDSYPLASRHEVPADPNSRRFMGVDLIDFLGKIAEKVIIHYPDDFKHDIDALYRAAGKADFQDRRLMWHVSSYGTHINSERDTFIKDTYAFNTWVDYRSKEPDMFGYIVEVTGRKGSTVTGNVFEVGDYYAHTLHVRDSALLLDSVSLTYSDAWGVNAGKTVTVPRYEYNDDRHRLMSESGNVTAIRYHPWEALKTMTELLHQERSRRMAYPIGSQEEHLKKLGGKLAEIRKPPEQALPKLPTPKKQSITSRLADAEAEAKAYNAQREQNSLNTTKNKKKEIE